MAIVRMLPDVDPAEVAEGQMVLVDSDAPDNARAILEVEQWCREYGLWRADEQHLSTVFADGRLLRRARCYRPYGEEVKQRSANSAEIDRRAAAMPLTEPSARATRGG